MGMYANACEQLQGGGAWARVDDSARLEAPQVAAFDLSALPTLCFSADASQEATCQICLESFVPGELLRALPCMHLFHVACADAWLSRSGSCPICRCKVWQEDVWQGDVD